jgi:hypothetical protein
MRGRPDIRPALVITANIIELNEEIDGLKHEITLLKEELAEANELLAQQREKELVNT